MPAEESSSEHHLFINELVQHPTRLIQYVTTLELRLREVQDEFRRLRPEHDSSILMDEYITLTIRLDDISDRAREVLLPAEQACYYSSPEPLAKRQKACSFNFGVPAPYAFDMRSWRRL